MTGKDSTHPLREDWKVLGTVKLPREDEEVTKEISKVCATFVRKCRGRHKYFDSQFHASGDKADKKR